MEENNNSENNSFNTDPLEESCEKIYDTGARIFKQFTDQATTITEKGFDKVSDKISKVLNTTIDGGSVFADKLLDDYIRMMDKAEKMLTSKQIEFLSYRELIDLVIKNKPSTENFKRAAIVKRIIGSFDEKKIKLTIAYLDSNDRPIWKDSNGDELSVVIIAKKIDDEIKEVFGNKDTIIIE